MVYHAGGNGNNAPLRTSFNATSMTAVVLVTDGPAKVLAAATLGCLDEFGCFVVVLLDLEVAGR